MVTRSLIIITFSALFALSANADLRWTPRESEYDVEGMRLKQLSFSDAEGRQITYQQPPGWDYYGNVGQLTLHPPDKPEAEGTVTHVKLLQPGVLNEEATRKMAEEAVISVPRGSTNVVLISQEKNPVLIGQKETFLVIVSYEFRGKNYKRSLMFLNRDNEQVRFEFVSRATDFDELQRAFLGSMFSWQNL